MTDDDQKDRIRFHYLKPTHFTTVHADGVVGGISPTGHIHAAFYTERLPIPRVIDYEISEGKLGNEIPESRVVRDGIVRELMVNVALNLNSAIALREWLDGHIQKLEAALKSEGKP